MCAAPLAAPRAVRAGEDLAAPLAEMAEDLAAGSPSDSQPCAACEPDVWIVDSRAAGCCCAPDKLRYLRAVDCRWLPATEEEFSAGAGADRPWVIYVHGNNMQPADARQSGWQMYQLVGRHVCQPIRFVIWSWPSDRECRFDIKDLREKAYVGEIHGYYLAWLLDRMAPPQGVSLIGYSYGTRLISSGMHMLGGGSVCGRALAEREHPQAGSARLMLVAAAQDTNGFSPGGRYQLALTQARELVVFRNCRDGVLRFYRRLDKLKGPPALGVTGIDDLPLATAGPVLVSELNVAREVGCQHSLSDYLESPPIVGAMRRFVREASAARVGDEQAP